MCNHIYRELNNFNNYTGNNNKGISLAVEKSKDLKLFAQATTLERVPVESVEFEINVTSLLYGRNCLRERTIDIGAGKKKHSPCISSSRLLRRVVLPRVACALLDRRVCERTT